MDQSQLDRRPLTGTPFTLPSIATMTKGMNHPDVSPSQRSVTSQHSGVHSPGNAFDIRDSGNWSMQSKHSSTVSSNTGLHIHTILNSEDSPNRFSAISSTSSGTPGSSRITSSRQDVILPALTESFDNHAHQPIDAVNTSFLDSRRSSIDSRVNVNMGHLALSGSNNNNGSIVSNGNNPGSPYESNNASQVSLASSLQHQRGIHTPIQPKASGAPGLSPMQRRPVTSAGPGVPARRAPAITGPRTGGMPDPTASTPTKGFAWAFPGQDVDKDDFDLSSGPSSRQNSLAASSIHTMESAPYHMRNGRFSDEPIDTHHHSMQHKSISNLQNAADQLGTGNYSRTPELRVSHKLAERKRRSEMKDLFDQLNRHIPNSTGSKSSKWEILSKAIEYIANLKGAYHDSQREVDKLRAELEQARAAVDENMVFQNEITAMYQQLLRVDPDGHHVFGPKTQYLVSQKSQPTSNRLAPMQQAGQQAPWPTSAPMQGVEYGGHHYERR